MGKGYRSLVEEKKNMYQKDMESTEDHRDLVNNHPS